jgi:hypothetical protein
MPRGTVSEEGSRAMQSATLNHLPPLLLWMWCLLLPFLLVVVLVVPVVLAVASEVVVEAVAAPVAAVLPRVPHLQLCPACQ